jgi:hypothetical protein
VQDKTNIRFVRSSYGPYNVFFIGADIIKTIRAMVPQVKMMTLRLIYGHHIIAAYKRGDNR